MGGWVVKGVPRGLGLRVGTGRAPPASRVLRIAEEPGVSRTGDFGFSYAARWFSNHSHSTSLGVIYPKAE